LVSVPSVARKFGGFATEAMALLMVTAIMIGSAIQYNTRVIKPILAKVKDEKIDFDQGAWSLCPDV
jgi:hypothetical protein